MGRKLSPANDEIDPALLRELLSHGDQRLLNDDEVTALNASVVKQMRAAGLDPALVYAYERTGLLVAPENRELMSRRWTEEGHWGSPTMALSEIRLPSGPKRQQNQQTDIGVALALSERQICRLGSERSRRAE
jgi:hypothetical protein